MDPFERKLRSAFQTYRLEDVRLVSEIRFVLSGHREVLLRERSGDGLALARGLSDAVDTLLRAWVDACPSGRGLALLALGGYGRGELNPRSDVDILILHPDGTDERAAELTGPLLAFLWDLGHVVGHAVRSLSGCRETMAHDLPSATALLEGRLVTGSRVLFRQFVEEVVDPWLREHRDDFIGQKIDEARARHRFYGGTHLLLTPNVKESAGGLRDMHVAGWIGFALSGRKDFRVFREAGLLLDEDSGDLLKAYSDMHRIRSVLHLRTGAKQDVLDPAARPEVARRLGFTDHSGFSASEHFMRHYYSAAITLSGFLSRVIRFRFHCVVEDRREPLAPGLLVVGGEVYPENAAAVATPVEALDAVVLTRRHGLEPSPDLEEAVRIASLELDDAARLDPELSRRFFDLLRDDRAGEALRLLDRTGFLGAYIPEYGRLAGLAREDPHHQFTVDEHTLRAVDAFDSLSAPDHPRRDEVLKLARPDLVRLALLLHDIGKARAGDHVERGTAMVPDVTDRLGLPEEDARLVRFLVAGHLLLTGLADRRVPADATKALAEAVPNRGRLRALFLLTLADIQAVGRGALSGWREAQLDALYRSTLEILSARRVPPFAERVVEAAGADRESEARDHIAGMGARYALEVEASRVCLHLDLVRRLEDRRVALSHLPGDAFTEVWVGARDVQGLFGRIAGVLTMNDLDIVGAHAYTREDGVALDGFFVTRDGRAPGEDGPFWERVAANLSSVVEGTLDLDERMRRHRNRYRPGSDPAAPLRPLGATWSDEVSDRYTAVEITARDRPGLLHDLALCISRGGHSIHHAIVATKGAEVTDTFYVTASGGHRPGRESLSALVLDLDRVVGEGKSS